MSIIDTIDKGLEAYFIKLGRDDYKDDEEQGKFYLYCENNGFDGDDVVEELKEDPEQSSVPDAFKDEDDDEAEIDFPFQDPQPKDELEKQQRIVQIIKNIVSGGDGAGAGAGGDGGGGGGDDDDDDEKKEEYEKFELDIEICNDLEEQELDIYTNKYTSQMNTLKAMNNRDGDLKWYLAIGKKQNYPFLTYMVDSFTKEKAEQYFAQKKSATPTLTVNTWAQKNKFFMALRKKYPQKADQLLSAMTNYCNRIMNRLQFQPIYKIEDSLQSITEYIASMPQFIRKFLIKSAKATPPFQVDLLIAVRKVKSQLADDNAGDDEEDDDDEVDETETNQMDPTKDHIGDVQQEFKEIPIYYAPPNDKFAIEMTEKKEEAGEVIMRALGQRYNEFRSVLAGDKQKDDHKCKAMGKSKKFNKDTYPLRRRFSILIDRREDKPTESEQDEMTFFEPPDDCNDMASDHVPEIGFEFLKTCILPRNSKPHVCATDGLCGQLMTFMFNVEAVDEIKCYIIWNGQTMRFHGDHITKILPTIFVDNEQNKKFAEGEETKKLQEIFETNIDDRKFSQFYKALTEYEGKKVNE